MIIHTYHQIFTKFFLFINTFFIFFSFVSIILLSIIILLISYFFLYIFYSYLYIFSITSFYTLTSTCPFLFTSLLSYTSLTPFLFHYPISFFLSFSPSPPSPFFLFTSTLILFPQCLTSTSYISYPFTDTLFTTLPIPSYFFFLPFFFSAFTFLLVS